MPETVELEGGQWSRVNSRAASMIITALPDTVRQEVVARRLAKLNYEAPFSTSPDLPAWRRK